MTLTDADIDALPYRPCVGIMLLNQDGRIFAGQRIDNAADAWQMPQGGIDPGESPEAAAVRELGEEAGVAPGDLVLLRESATWRAYDLPRGLVPRLWGGRYRGQSQRWFAFRYRGVDGGISIETDEPEFRCWAWMAPGDLLDRIVPFKRDTYRDVFDEFSDLLDAGT